MDSRPSDKLEIVSATDTSSFNECYFHCSIHVNPYRGGRGTALTSWKRGTSEVLGTVRGGSGLLGVVGVGGVLGAVRVTQGGSRWLGVAAIKHRANACAMFNTTQ